MATTWFAQNSSVNIDSANEWNDAANGSGNWLTWANLAADDVLCANAKTAILINCDFACARISTVAEVPIQGGSNGAAGGGFTFSGTTSRTITMDVKAGTTTCLNTSHTSCTLTVIAPAGSTYVITGGSNTNQRGIYHNSAGTIDVTGNISAGSGSGAAGLYNNTSGTINVTGNITGGSGNGAGLYNNSTGAVTVNGNVSSGSGNGLANTGPGTVTINGNANGSAVGGVTNTSTGTINVTGDITGGSGGSGLYNGSTGGVNVNGTVTGGTGGTGHGIRNDGTGAVTVTGNLVNTLGSSAVAGPIRYTPGPTNYIQYPYSGTPGEDYKYPKQLAAANVKSGVAHGDITGAYTGPDEADVAAAVWAYANRTLT